MVASSKESRTNDRTIVRIRLLGGPITSGRATAPCAAGYQTVMRSSVRCLASRTAPEGWTVVRCVSPATWATAAFVAGHSDNIDKANVLNRIIKVWTPSMP